MYRTANYYPAKRLDYLPEKVYTKDAVLQFEYLKEAEVINVYSIVQESARTGRNVGLHEYPDLPSFKDSLEQAEGFSIRQMSGNNLSINMVDGAIFIQPCQLARSVAPCVAHVHVFLSDSLYRQNMYREVIGQGLRYAKDLQLEYTTALVWVFQTCAEIIADLRKDGFQPVCCLPNLGEVTKYGMVDTWCLVKDIDGEKMLRPMEEIRSYTEIYFGGLNHKEKSKLPTLPFLPFHYTLESGLQCIWRYLKQDGVEDTKVFNMFTSLLGKDAGFGTDEYPNFETFKYCQLLHNHCMVIEDVKSGEIMGFASFGDSWISRGCKGLYNESSGLVNPKYRSLHVGSEMMDVLQSMAKKAGYKYHLGDSAIQNTKMRLMENRRGFVPLGIIPNSIYLQKLGWTDVVISVLPTERVKDYSYVLKQQQDRNKAKI